MSGNGFYGEKVAEACRLTQATTLVSLAVKKSLVAMTHINVPTPDGEFTVPTPKENAIMLTLAKGGYDRQLQIEGALRGAPPRVDDGHLAFIDLRARSCIRFETSAEIVQYYVPLAALNTISEEAGGPRIDELYLPTGSVLDDVQLNNLARAMQPAFARPQEVSQLFLDHITQAAVVHIAGTYCGLQRYLEAGPASTIKAKGGLAPWQVRRIRDRLASQLDGNLSLSDLAGECGVSTGHFTRAFRETFGMRPHQWLLQHRIDQSKAMLRRPDGSLAAVADLCGFADQSHFTRVFRQFTGSSPGQWRRHFNQFPQAEAATSF